MASTIQIKRGTGSAVPSGLADGELAINLDNGQLYFGSGSTSVNSFRFTNLTADNYIVSSSVTNITTQTLSGSTQFGDSADDTHQFTGAITASSNISASGRIITNVVENLNSLTLGDVDGNVGGVRLLIQQTGQVDLLNATTTTITGNTIKFIDSAENKTAKIELSGPVTASGNISSSGTIVAASLQDTSLTAGRLVSVTTNGVLNDDADFTVSGNDMTLGRDLTIGRNLIIDAGTISNVSTTHVTASGNISASGTIFTDTISSPTNNLVISSSTVRLTATTDGEANLILEADSDNDDENDNPFMDFLQDGGGVTGQIGISGDVDKWPDGDALTGVTSNGMVIGMKGSGTSTNRQLFFATADTVALKLDNSQNATFTGNITANGNIIGDGATDISGIDTITTSGQISSSGGSIYATRAFINGKRALDISSNIGSLFDGLAADGSILLGKSNMGIPVFANGSITSSNDISASGDLIGGRANIINRVITPEITSLTTLTIVPDITASGNISASGNILSDNFLADNGNHIIGHHSVDGLQIRTQNSDPIVFKTNGNNIRASIASDGVVNIVGNLDLDGNVIGDGATDISGIDEITTDRIRLTSTTDASATSTGHAFQAGLTSAVNIIIDNNEIMARNNGSEANLHLNADGGDVFFHNNVANSNTVISPTTGLAASGHITASGNISASGNLIGTEAHVTTIQSPDSLGVLELLGDNKGSVLKINSTNATGNRVVGLEMSASGDGHVFSLGLGRGNVDGVGTFVIAPTVVSTAEANAVFEMDTTGNITSSGAISSSGIITADSILSVGRLYMGAYGGSNPFIASTTAGIEVKNGSLDVDSHITASGNISSSGDIVCNNLNTTGTIIGKQIQLFSQSFLDDLGTSVHYLPWKDINEQTTIYQEEAAMVMPYDGRIKSVTIRMSSIATSGNRTIGIHTIGPNVSQFTTSDWTTEETETMAISDTDDNHVFYFVFDNAKHFESGELVTISIQDDADLTSGHRYYYVTTVVEFDLNNGFGTGTTSAEFESAQ